MKSVAGRISAPQRARSVQTRRRLAAFSYLPGAPLPALNLATLCFDRLRRPKRCPQMGAGLAPSLDFGLGAAQRHLGAGGSRNLSLRFLPGVLHRCIKPLRALQPCQNTGQSEEKFGKQMHASRYSMPAKHRSPPAQLARAARAVLRQASGAHSAHGAAPQCRRARSLAVFGVRVDAKRRQSSQRTAQNPFCAIPTSLGCGFVASGHAIINALFCNIVL